MRCTFQTIDLCKVCLFLFFAFDFVFSLHMPSYLLSFNKIFENYHNSLTESGYSAIHKAAGLTVHGRSEPKHPITHARSCEKNGAGGCEITVSPSAFPYPFFSTQKSRRTERPPGVVLYGGFASFSVPIG